MQNEELLEKILDIVLKNGYFNYDIPGRRFKRKLFSLGSFRFMIRIGNGHNEIEAIFQKNGSICYATLDIHEHFEKLLKGKTLSEEKKQEIIKKNREILLRIYSILKEITNINKGERLS